MLPEGVKNLSRQNVNEENGQADVEQDDHAHHDGVWALKERTKRLMSSVISLNDTNRETFSLSCSSNGTEKGHVLKNPRF